MTEQEISPAADRWSTVSRGASNRARSARLRAPGADCPPDAAAPGSVRFGCLETTPQAVSVMLVLHSHIRGGTEQHAVPLPERCRRRGHQVVFAGPAGSWLADTLRQSGFPGYHVPLHGFCGVWSVIRLCRAAISFGADVRHGHLTLGAFYAGSVRKLTGRASVATAHWMNCHQRFAWTGKIIAVPDVMRGHLVEKGQDPDRIAVMRMVSMCRSCRPVNGQRRRRELGLVQGQIALCLDWYQVLRRKVRDAGLEQRVRSPGHRDDVSDAPHGVDIFCARLAPGGIPRSGPPGMRQRCPGHRHIRWGYGRNHSHGENGLLFDAGDADTRSALIRQLAAMGDDAKGGPTWRSVWSSSASRSTGWSTRPSISSVRRCDGHAPDRIPTRIELSLVLLQDRGGPARSRRPHFCDVGRFRAQMGWVKDSGYPVISLA